MEPYIHELRTSLIAWHARWRAALEPVRAAALAKMAEIISTPGASAAVQQAKAGLDHADPVVRAEWSGIDELHVRDWPRFASRRAAVELAREEREAFRQGAFEANRERSSAASERREDHRARALLKRRADPSASDVKIAREIFAELSNEDRKGQSPETIRKNIRGAG